MRRCQIDTEFSDISSISQSFIDFLGDFRWLEEDGEGRELSGVVGSGPPTRSDVNNSHSGSMTSPDLNIDDIVLAS